MGHYVSEETRKKLSHKHMGKTWSKTALIKRTNSRKGYTHSKETRLKISKSNKNVFNRPEMKKKMRDIFCSKKPKFKNTIPEILLQKALTKQNIKFETQKIISGKNFVHPVDIFIKPNICVEVDGNYWHSLPHKIKRDKKIDIELRNKNYFVLRFWEKTIKENIESCVWIIKLIIRSQLMLRVF